MNSNWAIEVQGLRYSYHPNKKRKEDKSYPEVLQNLSFQVPLGKITALLGPNGSGKSTTFKILSTQILPSNGNGQVLGLSLSSQAAAIREVIGVTFQSPSLDPHLTVLENLKHFAALYGLTNDLRDLQIEQLLKTFHLVERKDSRVKELSGGLARRVELAKALLPDPKILLLDEPTTGLDPALRRDFWLELFRLRDLGMSILVTTHLMDEADFCDELIFIADGKWAGQGSPSQLKSDYGFDVITMAFKNPDDMSFESQAVKEISSLLIEGEKLQVNRGNLRIECKRAAQILQILARDFENSLQNISWGKPNLSDVYFSKTGKALS